MYTLLMYEIGYGFAKVFARHSLFTFGMLILLCNATPKIQGFHSTDRLLSVYQINNLFYSVTYLLNELHEFLTTIVTDGI